MSTACLTELKPLHVRTSEALEKAQLYSQHLECPRYDLDWKATGPLIERFGIKLRRIGQSTWLAGLSGSTYEHGGATPMIAVCHLVIALSATGNLK